MIKVVHECIKRKICNLSTIFLCRAVSLKANKASLDSKMEDITENSSRNDIPGEFSAILTNETLPAQSVMEKRDDNDLLTKTQPELSTVKFEKVDQTAKRKMKVPAAHVNKKVSHFFRNTFDHFLYTH